jgi:hypothetical protein
MSLGIHRNPVRLRMISTCTRSTKSIWAEVPRDHTALNSNNPLRRARPCRIAGGITGFFEKFLCSRTLNPLNTTLANAFLINGVSLSNHY